MKSLVFLLALFSYVAFFAQTVSRVTFYSHIELIGNKGKLGRTNKITDGYGDKGTGINIGFQARLNRKWGFSAEFSDWFFQADIDRAIPLIRQNFQELYNVENRPILTASSGYVDHWQFSVIKAGAFYSFLMPHGRGHLDFKMGYMLPVGRDGSFLVRNQNQLIQSDNRQLLYLIETHDGLTAYTYTEVGSGLLGEFNFQYYLHIPKANWFTPFAGLGLQIGSFEYIKVDFTEETSNPSLNQSLSKSNRMGFVSPRLQIGVSINFLPLD